MSIKTDLTICIQLEWNVREKQRRVRATRPGRREDGAIDGLGVTDETYYIALEHFNKSESSRRTMQNVRGGLMAFVLP
jgi:hypothetical protein